MLLRRLDAALLLNGVDDDVDDVGDVDETSEVGEGSAAGAECR